MCRDEEKKERRGERDGGGQRNEGEFVVGSKKRKKNGEAISVRGEKEKKVDNAVRVNL